MRSAMMTGVANKFKGGVAGTTIPFLTYNHTWSLADIQSNQYDGAGVGSGVRIPSDDVFNFMGDDFSIELKGIVIDTNADAITAIASKWGPETEQGWLLFRSNGTNLLTFVYTTDGSTDITTVFGSTALTNGVTYDFSIIRSGADLNVYVDSVQVGATHDISTSIIKDNTRDFIIGNYAQFSSPFLFGGLDGRIDQIKISNVAVSSTMPTLLTNDADTVYLNTFFGADGSTPTLNTET